MRETINWFAENWRLRTLKSQTSEKFITSDNPSTIYTEPKNSRPVMVYLPVHPDLAVVAFDKRCLAVTDPIISDDALGVLNGVQINRSIRHTFSDHDLKNKPEEWDALQKLTDKEKPERWVDGNRWVRDFISIANPLFDRFTFMNKIGHRVFGCC